MLLNWNSSPTKFKCLVKSCTNTYIYAMGEKHSECEKMNNFLSLRMIVVMILSWTNKQIFHTLIGMSDYTYL